MKRVSALQAIVILILALFFCLSLPATSAKKGTGFLYVYINADYTILAPPDDIGFYEVLPGQEVYIQIANITEFEIGEQIIVKICWNDHTYTTSQFAVKTLAFGEGSGLPGVGDKANPLPWTVGVFDDGTFTIPFCETMTVHYKSAEEPPGPDYITVIYDTDKGMVMTAHMHIVPEIPLGTIGSLLALLSGFEAFILIKRKNNKSKDSAPDSMRVCAS